MEYDSTTWSSMTPQSCINYRETCQNSWIFFPAKTFEPLLPQTTSETAQKKDETEIKKTINNKKKSQHKQSNDIRYTTTIIK